jgi:hypothetical protein
MQIEIFLDYGFYLEKNYSFPKLEKLLINIINLTDNEENFKSLKEPVDYFLCNSNFQRVERNYDGEPIFTHVVKYEYLLKNYDFQKTKFYIPFVSKLLEKQSYLIEYIPTNLMSFSFQEKAISTDPFLIRLIKTNNENYYSLVKTAYLKDKNIIRLLQIPKEYKEQLKKDFPNEN